VDSPPPSCIRLNRPGGSVESASRLRVGILALCTIFRTMQEPGWEPAVESSDGA
jgi:hypothetical protein